MLTKMSWHYTVWLGHSELMILIINEQYGNIQLIISPVPKDRGMLWFYVKAARRPSPAMVLTR